MIDNPHNIISHAGQAVPVAPVWSKKHP